MGNAFACMPRKEHRGAALASRSKRMGSARAPRGGAAKLTPAEEELLHRQALAMAIHQHLDAGGSMSRRIDAGGASISRRIGPGSTSSRRHGSLPDSVTNAKAVQVVLENLETKKIVLVHGEGFGAWCWYKTISLLEEAGLDPVALDLAGSGIDHTDANGIATLEEYSKPLIDYLSKLPENEKVVLVGHSCGGASVSYALEQCPEKISKAVFLTATMVKDSQRPFDVFSEEMFSCKNHSSYFMEMERTSLPLGSGSTNSRSKGYISTKVLPRISHWPPCPCGPSLWPQSWRSSPSQQRTTAASAATSSRRSMTTCCPLMSRRS
ncbi:unnamed protein product [Alopecurus aequalis]